jgi:hypothetical protein
MLSNTLYARRCRIRYRPKPHHQRSTNSNNQQSKNPCTNIRQEAAYGEHKERNRSIKALKALSSKEWGKHKENDTCYIVKPHLEYACTAWGPIVAKTNISRQAV